MSVDDVKKSVFEILSEAKDIVISAINDDLLIEQLELDSLDLVEVVVMAKKKFGVTIVAEDFKDCVTVGHLCDIISKKKV